jgi:uncharacterized protein (TIGR02270 family)
MAAYKPVIFPVVEQHAEEAGFLWMQRRAAVGSANISLRILARQDARLAAHIDGIRLAERAGETACAMQLQAADPGSMFVSAALLVEAGNSERVEQLLALCETVPQLRPGLFAALGWCEARFLSGWVLGMFKSSNPFRRLAGTAACSMHRVDPGITSARCLEDPDPHVRARALRTAGELGRRELVSRFAEALRDEDPMCRFWAAWTAVLLGDRNNAPEILLSAGLGRGSQRMRAFQLAMMSMNTGEAHGVLRQLAADSADLRYLIRGSGFAGDPRYARWLIEQMDDDRCARLAGEAFSLITGTDLTALNLTRRRPESFDSGPNDDPNDPNVEMDEDDSLPWPDTAKIAAWWQSNASRFQPGTRYFMGAPLNRDDCLRVLKEGFQRQRIAAALYLSLLNPGTPLFEWRAPARRQQRLLAEMV